MLLQRYPINVQSRELFALLAASTGAKLHITELLTLSKYDMVPKPAPQGKGQE